MEVKVCKVIGFCRGVEQTLEKASLCIEKARQCNLPSYSIGNLIHNEHVVKEFEQKGLKIIENPSDSKPGIALVRAHGIPEKLRRQFIDSGYVLIDSTCANIRATVSAMDKACKEGRKIIVVGIPGHSETLTLLGSQVSFEINKAAQVRDLEKKISPAEKIGIAVQTTFNEKEFNAIVQEVKSRYRNVVVLNGFCRECMNRKKYALELAQNCNAVVVVGSSESANSSALADYIMAENKNVFFIGGPDDLTPCLLEKLRAFATVGVCSGTSTPSYIIDSVIKTLEDCT